MGADSEELAAWIVKNEKLKGTPQFDTVAKGLEESLQAEKLQAGQGEYANESILYERPQVGVGRKLAQSAGKGVVGALDTLIGAPEAVGRMYQYATNKDMPLPNYPAPIQTALTKAGVFTPEAEFNTPAGRIADTATQMYTGGGFNPAKTARTLLTKPAFDATKEIAKQVALTGAQGLTAGSTSELLKESGIDNPLAQFALTGGTTALAGAPFGIRNTASDIANQATKNVTPAQMKAAQDLVTQSYKLGSPITGAEALAKITGASPLTAVQRVVENLPQSSETMATFMANRPQANEQMVANALRQISPNQPTSATPLALQQAGKQVVRGAEKGVTESVAPFYQKGVNEMQNLQAGKTLPVMPTEVAALQRNPAIADAIDHVTKNAYTGVQGLPATDPRVLSAAKVYLDAQYSKFSNNMTESLDKAKAGNAWGASRELDSYLSAKSPSYAQGSKNFETAQKIQIEPMKAGPIGQIAEGNVEANTLMPAKPVSLYPADIKRAADLLRRKNPSALPDWTRQQLEAVFNETSQNLQNGPNQFGGAKFASTITGNKQQKDNLRTLVTQGSGMQAWKGFEDVLDTLEAQGTRQGAGSATSFNNQFQRQFAEGGPLAAGKLIFKPSEVATKYEEWQMGKNANKLAKMLTDPESVKKLEEIARTGPKSAKGQILVNSLIGGYISQKPEITEESK